jgi:pathogenesis-related protein 1
MNSPKSKSAPRPLRWLLGAVLLATACDDGGGGGGSHSIMLGDASVTAGEPAQLAGITALHNQARAMVSPAADPAIPPLTWSNTVASAAQAWADGCNWSHSSNPYGENIYASAGSTLSGYSVVSSWISEEENYHYSSNSCDDDEVCGHYTQVVWRSTTQLGCAYKHCTSGTPFGANFPEWDFVVCNYSPPGNNGSRPY